MFKHKYFKKFKNPYHSSTKNSSTDKSVCYFQSEAKSILGSPKYYNIINVFYKFRCIETRIVQATLHGLSYWVALLVASLEAARADAAAAVTSSHPS